MSVVRTALGTALAGTAKVLSLSSKVLDATARTLRPDSGGAEDSPVQRPPGRRAVEAPGDADSTAEVIDQVADAAAERGRVVEASATPRLDDTPHVRTSESHIEELASKPATEVISAVSGLSTDELRLLIEHETAHKNRTTVLAAIERALAPPPARAGKGSGSRQRKHRSEQREIILPEAGGVPTSGDVARQ